MTRIDIDVATLQRAQAGDLESLAGLYDRHGGATWRLALRIAGDRAAAAESMREAWLQLWRRSAEFDPRRGAVLAWLLAVVRTRALDHRDGRPPAPAPPPEDAVTARARRALTMLEAAERALLEAAWFDGRNAPELASQTGGTPRSTLAAMRRALLRLRELAPPPADDGGSPIAPDPIRELPPLAHQTAAHAPEWLDLSAGWALGALDPEGRARLTGHLANGCRECEDAMRTLSEGVLVLSQSAGGRGADPALRERLLAEAQQWAGPAAAETPLPPPGATGADAIDRALPPGRASLATGVREPAVPPPPHESAPGPTSPAPGARPAHEATPAPASPHAPASPAPAPSHAPAAAAPRDAWSHPAPVPVPHPAPVPVRPPARGAASLLPVAAVVVFAVTTALLWSRAHNLSAELAVARARLQQIAQSPQNDPAWTGVLLSPEARVSLLAPTTQGDAQLRGRVTYDPRSRRAIAVFENLYPPESGVYELWVIRDRTPVSLGALQPDSAGRATARLADVGSSFSLSAFGVSVEQGPPPHERPGGPFVMLGNLGE